jgi:cytochrome c biogenesis protein CcdA
MSRCQATVLAFVSPAVLVAVPFIAAYVFAVAGTQGRSRRRVAALGALPLLVIVFFVLAATKGDGR